MDQKQALEIHRRYIDTYNGVRQSLDAWWLLAIMYDGGEQWANVTSRGGRLITRQFNNIVDSKREDVRVTLDLIHSKVNRIAASMKPRKISATMTPASGSNKHRLAADSGQTLFKRWAEKTSALSVLRDKELPREVLGSAFIKRVISNRGSIGEAGIRSFDLRWDVCYPWEFIRSTAATTTRISRDEEYIAHGKPKSIGWVNRNFGLKLDPKEIPSTLGQLQDMQSRVFSAQGPATTTKNSMEKGVMVYEAYFKDPNAPSTGDPRTDWKWCLMTYSTSPSQGGMHEVLKFGPNPFYSLPFHMFSYDKTVSAPWGRGIPHIERRAQDIFNLGMTWTMRLMQQGSGKIMLEAGTVEDEANALSNRIDKPLIWHRNGMQNANPPQRLAPPIGNPAIYEMINRIPGWMDQSLNLSAVQRGETSKRGESGEAVRVKLSEANIPLEDLRTDDEMIMQDLIFCTLMDLTNSNLQRPDQLQKMLGADMPESHIMAMLTEPMNEKIISVKIHDQMIRPKTPLERRDEIVAMVQNNVITDPKEAQWNMTLKVGGINATMDNALRKQRMEIEAMKAGEDVEVHMPEAHKWHMRAIQEYVDHPSFALLDTEAQARIDEHFAEHQEAEILAAQGDAMLQQGAGGPGQQGAMPGAALPPELMGSVME